jgi:hypothetical protein
MTGRAVGGLATASGDRAGSGEPHASPGCQGVGGAATGRLGRAPPPSLAPGQRCGSTRGRLVGEPPPSGGNSAACAADSGRPGAGGLPGGAQRLCSGLVADGALSGAGQDAGSNRVAGGALWGGPQGPRSRPAFEGVPSGPPHGVAMLCRTSCGVGGGGGAQPVLGTGAAPWGDGNRSSEYGAWLPCGVGPAPGAASSGSWPGCCTPSDVMRAPPPSHLGRRCRSGASGLVADADGTGRAHFPHRNRSGPVPLGTAARWSALPSGAERCRSTQAPPISGSRTTEPNGTGRRDGGKWGSVTLMTPRAAGPVIDLEKRSKRSGVSSGGAAALVALQLRWRWAIGGSRRRRLATWWLVAHARGPVRAAGRADFPSSRR